MAGLYEVNLSGANLSEATYLTQEEIGQANGNKETKLPEGLKHPAAWSRSEAQRSNRTGTSSRIATTLERDKGVQDPRLYPEKFSRKLDRSKSQRLVTIPRYKFF